MQLDLETVVVLIYRPLYYRLQQWVRSSGSFEEVRGSGSHDEVWDVGFFEDVQNFEVLSRGLGFGVLGGCHNYKAHLGLPGPLSLSSRLDLHGRALTAYLGLGS